MAHCNTIFQHILKLIPRHHFSKLEREYTTGRSARTFSRWHQLVHLIFMQVTARASLRDGVAALKARFTNLYHLGVRPVARSTFSSSPRQHSARYLRSFTRRLSPVNSTYLTLSWLHNMASR